MHVLAVWAAGGATGRQAISTRAVQSVLQSKLRSACHQLLLHYNKSYKMHVSISSQQLACGPCMMARLLGAMHGI